MEVEYVIKTQIQITVKEQRFCYLSSSQNHREPYAG